MGKKFTSKQIGEARRKELYDFLISNHSEAIKRKGSTLLLKGQKSVKVRKGYSGYIDYLTSERGNSIDFLMRYLDYTFEEAVDALLHIQGGGAIR